MQNSNSINKKDNIRSVAVGCDHGAVEQKEIIRKYLLLQGYRVVDVGCQAGEKVDYPDYAVAVCRKVVNEDCERGIMLDGAGIGSSMVCNKVNGIRAALCYDMRTIVNSREHNNANVLTLGGPLHSGNQLCEMVKLWLETRFPRGRHMVRINKMMAVEKGVIR